LTNKEIGRQLYLSHRTVGGHLYRVFPKLGITARAQLASLVAAETTMRVWADLRERPTPRRGRD
jgi:DNA-binding NarL/FixJ family response regulator